MHICNSHSLSVENLFSTQLKDHFSMESTRFKLLPPHLNWIESLLLNKEESKVRVPLKRIVDFELEYPVENELDPIQRIFV